MEGLALIIIMALIYFAPTLIAAARKKRNTSAIFVTNLFLGWTLLGWVIPLAWAFTYEKTEA